MNIRIWVALGLLFLANLRHEVLADDDETTITGIETTSETSAIINAPDLSQPVIDRSSHVHIHTKPTFKGLWKKNMIWRPRWLKTWKEKKIYVAVWKRVWGPVFVNEYVPVPRPPPGWIKHKHRVFVKRYPY